MREEAMSSAAEHQWTEIAESLRQVIAKQVPLMPAMKPDEQKQFVDMIGDVFWLEVKANNFDAYLEQTARKTAMTTE
jgi:predicted ATPase